MCPRQVHSEARMYTQVCPSQRQLFPNATPQLTTHQARRGRIYHKDGEEAMQGVCGGNRVQWSLPEDDTGVPRTPSALGESCPPRPEEAPAGVSGGRQVPPAAIPGLSGLAQLGPSPSAQAPASPGPRNDSSEQPSSLRSKAGGQAGIFN